MKQTVVEADPLQKALFTQRLDNILLHRTWGYLILITVLFLLFQSIFVIAQFPMNAIEWTFAQWHTRRIKRYFGFRTTDNDIIWPDHFIGRHGVYGADKFFNG